MISVFNGIDLFILYHLKKVFLKICMFQNGFVSYFFWKRCFWTFQSVWVWFRSFVMLPPLPLFYSLYPFPLGVSTTPLTNPILRPPISPRYFNQFCTNNFFRVNHINHFPLRGLTGWLPPEKNFLEDNGVIFQDTDFQFFALLQSRPIFGGSGSDPSKVERLWLLISIPPFLFFLIHTSVSDPLFFYGSGSDPKTKSGSGSWG